jgi:hypothetical protein
VKVVVKVKYKDHKTKAEEMRWYEREEGLTFSYSKID